MSNCVADKTLYFDKFLNNIAYKVLNNLGQEIANFQDHVLVQFIFLKNSTMISSLLAPYFLINTVYLI